MARVHDILRLGGEHPHVGCGEEHERVDHGQWGVVVEGGEEPAPTLARDRIAEKDSCMRRGRWDDGSEEGAPWRRCCLKVRRNSMRL